MLASWHAVISVKLTQKSCPQRLAGQVLKFIVFATCATWEEHTIVPLFLIDQGVLFCPKVLWQVMLVEVFSNTSKSVNSKHMC